MSERTIRPWEVDQTWLFPPSVQDFDPEGHIAQVIRRIVMKEFDLSPMFEPVFGRLEEARGFRRFLHSGLENVAAEWALLCTAHTLLASARP